MTQPTKKFKDVYVVGTTAQPCHEERIAALEEKIEKLFAQPDDVRAIIQNTVAYWAIHDNPSPIPQTKLQGETQ